MAGSITAQTIIHIVNNRTNSTSTISQPVTTYDSDLFLAYPTRNHAGVPVTTITIGVGRKNSLTSVL